MVNARSVLLRILLWLSEIQSSHGLGILCRDPGKWGRAFRKLEVLNGAFPGLDRKVGFISSKEKQQLLIYLTSLPKTLFR